MKPSVVLHSLFLCALAFSPCWAGPVDTSLASEATQQSYAKEGSNKGLVILSVNWGRKWGCGEFENAELRELSFDRLPTNKVKDDELGDLVLKGPLRVFSKLAFIDYVFLIEPGEYALSWCSIKVARSISDVGYFKVGRTQLITDGKAQGGSFTVNAGESVYIGHFFLDCAGQPMLWRYYTEGRKRFDENMAAISRKYSFLDVRKIQFRLFRTDTFGVPYELPADEQTEPNQPTTPKR